MSTDFLRNEDRLRTIRQRLGALDRSSQKQVPSGEKLFASFSGATIYPPILYLPQALGIRFASLFSTKVYVFFYSARILNAIIAITLAFLALYLAPSHQYLLLIPAVLPISLCQFASLSTDAAIIALSMLFVALCIRFVDADARTLRLGIVLTLLLLTLGKPVYLPAALLLMAAHRRLGWRRTIVFCSEVSAICAGAYVVWSQMARELFVKAASDFPNRNPPLQIHFILMHPMSAINIFLTTLLDRAGFMIIGVIGRLGWPAFLLPTWFYMAALVGGTTILGLVCLNRHGIRSMHWLWALSATFGMILAVLMASYVLWTPPRSPEVVGIQGRYLIPALVVFMFAAPSLSKFNRFARVSLRILTLGFFAVSAFWTVRVVDHYYFPRSELIGQNLYRLYNVTPVSSCAASVKLLNRSWFSVTETGQITLHNGNYHVLLAEPDGSIVGESDPALLGAGRAQWRANAWMPNRPERIDSWLIWGHSACTFGRVDVTPYMIPAA